MNSFKLSLDPSARFRQHDTRNLISNARANVQQPRRSGFAALILAAIGLGFAAIYAAQAFGIF